MFKNKLRTALESPIFWIARTLVSLRYRVHVEGLENLSEKTLSRGGGTLFLPNHPAELDPCLLMLVLFPRFRPRPLVVSHFFYLKGVRFFMDLVQALPLPNMDTVASKWKIKQMDQLFATISKELKEGGNFLVYPSGKLKMQEKEQVGGSSFVHSLLKECSTANVVLIRTTGLWGSKFSRALTGEVPNFGRVLLEGIKIICKNGIFFAPRRHVYIDITVAPNDFPFTGTRLECNHYLEQWYNRRPDRLKLVSFYFWKEQFPSVLISEEVHKFLGEGKVPVAIRQEVFAKLAQMSGRKASELSVQMDLAVDLGLDSLDLSLLYIFLEERYHVGQLELGQLRFVDDLLQLASGYKKGVLVTNQREEEFAWSQEKGRPTPHIPEAKSLQEAFLLSCGRMGSFTACADQMFGALSYRKFKIAAITLSLHFKKEKSSHIAILLPSTVSAYLTIFAVLLAKKIPVMLNWTTGVRALEHAVELVPFKTVVTSCRFLERVETADFGKLEDYFVFLEEISSRLSILEKIKGFLLSFLSPQKLLEKLDLREIERGEPTLILFTSGTESLPKAVPLSHANLLSNLQAALSCIPLTERDVLYGVLPPFHSFGFSVTGIFPLLAGLKVYYAPDPTDSYTMAHDLREADVTLLCLAPSFMSSLLRVANLRDLHAVRYFIAGSEKASAELYASVAAIGGGRRLLEGYGITECSPIVTWSRLERPAKGVGQPLPGVELAICDPESGALLPSSAEGEVLISGPNVFDGYLGAARSCFLEIEGKRWYRSGDRGRIDPDGSLILTGRLKRFVKIGGEMISLSGIEEDLSGGLPDVGSLALLAREGGEKTLLILFTEKLLNREEANALLRERGYGQIVKISEVRTLPEIPRMASGKINYRRLEELC